MEVLGLNNEIVAIANLFLNLCNLLAWETWNDAVNECCINATRFLEPLTESVGQLPQVNILADAVLQYVTIEENQLTWEYDKSLSWVAIESLITMIEQLYELAWVA